MFPGAVLEGGFVGSKLHDDIYIIKVLLLDLRYPNISLMENYTVVRNYPRMFVNLHCTIKTKISRNAFAWTPVRHEESFFSLVKNGRFDHTLDATVCF